MKRETAVYLLLSILIILLLPGITYSLTFSQLLDQVADGSKQGDPIYRENSAIPIAGHAGLIDGWGEDSTIGEDYSYWTWHSTAAGTIKTDLDGEPEFVITDSVKHETIGKFMVGSDFWGVRKKWGFTDNDLKRKLIIEVTKAQKDKPWCATRFYKSPGRCFRCDGLVEYAYESVGLDIVPYDTYDTLSPIRQYLALNPRWEWPEDERPSSVPVKGEPLINFFFSTAPLILRGLNTTLIYSTDFITGLNLSAKNIFSNSSSSPSVSILNLNSQSGSAKREDASINVSPNTTTRYTLTVWNNNQIISHTTTVKVLEIKSFISEKSKLQEGMSTKLVWTTAEADSVCISNNKNSERPCFTDTFAKNGSMDISPNTNTTYTITAYGLDKEISFSASVAVYPRFLINITSPVNGEAIQFEQGVEKVIRVEGSMTDLNLIPEDNSKFEGWVNGLRITRNGNINWYVDNVPIRLGWNILKVEANIGSHKASHSIVVYVPVIYLESPPPDPPHSLQTEVINNTEVRLIWIDGSDKRALATVNVIEGDFGIQTMASKTLVLPYATDQDEIFLTILGGQLPNACYGVKSSEVIEDSANNKFMVNLTVDRTIPDDSICTQALVDLDFIIKLSNPLEIGRYKIFLNIVDNVQLSSDNTVTDLELNFDVLDYGFEVWRKNNFEKEYSSLAVLVPGTTSYLDLPPFPDANPPDTVFDGYPQGCTVENVINSNSASFSFRAIDIEEVITTYKITAFAGQNVSEASNESSAAITNEFEFSYRLDNGNWSVWASSGEITFYDLADGIHTFEVKSKDREGNVDQTPASYTWTIDTIPPVPPVITSAGTGSFFILPILTLTSLLTGILKGLQLMIRIVSGLTALKPR